jgi:hypothetical protein
VTVLLCCVLQAGLLVVVLVVVRAWTTGLEGLEAGSLIQVKLKGATHA